MAELLEFLTTLLFVLWLGLMAFAWARFDVLPHGKLLYAISALWPLILAEDLLRLSGAAHWLAVLVGLFYCVPLLMMVAVALMSFPMVQKQPIRWRPLMYLGVVLVVGLQVPTLLLPASEKINLLMQQPQGNPLTYAPVYFVYGLTGLMIVGIGIKLVEAMQTYQNTLSEQVVDVSYYRVPTIISLLATMVGIGFAATILTALVAFNFVQFSWWQTTLHYAYGLVFLMIFILLLERRRYSPQPLDLVRLEKKQGEEWRLREALARAEKAMIQRKAYKVIGLRIEQLADAAGVDPTDLAIAIHVLLKRNFRAFVYHYRLEYAKKVLMRTDAKVTAVARRLGFESEKFLSDMFIKYITTMGARSASEFDDPLDAHDEPIFLDPLAKIQTPNTAASNGAVQAQTSKAN
ncbi:helix-turn-helix domain-containing protein [Alteromonas flava]|uniref:helix-turn-helix domain-containing protein n=1 Tax=Alteromonas flava TaxID=2048003 RepID=UPI000C29133C|nr:helix-turn-helix domain-containing protein [Alteromonas flava]